MRRFGRIVFLMGVTILSVTVLFIPTNPVKADPHATFFTAIGQRQLFFNMLAALDQADYVEPAENELGIPSGNSRQELLNKRTEAGFPANEDPVLKSTETELSSILTRSVTLEGQDMWSAYMSFQVALEIDRRRNSTELIKLLCERGLGIRKCKEGSEDPKVARAREEHAYNKRPLDQLAAQQLSGEYALRYLLNPAYDQMERRSVLSADNIDPNKDRPFNTSAATLGENTKDDPLKNQLARGMATSVLNLNTSNVDENMYSHISVGSDGNFFFDDNSTTANAIHDLGSILGASNQLLGARISAESQKRALDSTIYASGARADTKAIPNATNGIITNLNEELVAPSYSKKNQLDSAMGTITQLQTNSAYTGTEESIPGKKKLVPPTSTDEGEVKGVTSYNTTNGSRVAAATDEEEDDPNSHPGGIETDEDILPVQGPQTPIKRNVDPVGAVQEEPVLNFLQLLVGGSHRGLDISLESILQGYGTQILGSLNS